MEWCDHDDHTCRSSHQSVGPPRHRHLSLLDMPLRVGYGTCRFKSRTPPRPRIKSIVLISVREHFSSPLLQFAAEDRNKTFTLVECPSMLSRITLESPLALTRTKKGGTGQLISRLTNDEIDVAMWVSKFPTAITYQKQTFWQCSYRRTHRRHSERIESIQTRRELR